MPTEGNFNVGVARFLLETIDWVAAVVANGGTVSPARTSLVDGLIRGLKADGVWPQLDRLWLFAAENEPSALTDIVADLAATKNGAPTFAVDDGYTGATSSWIDSNVTLFTTPGLVFTANSGCVFGWATSSVQSIGALIAENPAGVTVLYPRYTDDNAYWRLSGPEAVTPSTDGSGFWCNVRDSATTNPIYRNGAAYAVNNVASTGPGADVVFLARPASAEWYIANCACAGIGGGLTATAAANLYSRLRIYMTDVGVP